MAETVIKLSNFRNNDNTEVVSSAQTATTDIGSVVKKIYQKDDYIINKFDSPEEAPCERIYPHVFDENSETGQARILILKGLADARLAIEYYNEADIESLGSRLLLISSSMSGAHSVTEFNESLGSVVSFLRRATLVASPAEVGRSALNVLLLVLRSISENPMIDLDEAGELVEKLADDGWNGELGFANKVLEALYDVETETDLNTQVTLI